MTRPVLDAPWEWRDWRLIGPMLWITVKGAPSPQGSKSFKGLTKTGRAILTESSKTLKPWRLQVQTATEDAIDVLAQSGAVFPMSGPVGIDVTFTMPKPKSAPKRRRTWQITKPDVDKLARAVLDAFTAAGAIRDDSQVIDLHVRKSYPLEGRYALSVPGITARLYTVTDATTPH